MIEATCTACGTVNRIADADVPVGAKFVNCASCKSRVGLTPSAGATKPGGAATALDFADLPAPRPRQHALGAEPAKPAPRSALDAASTPEPQLPAPRGGAKKPAGPAPGPLDLDDLLAPAPAAPDLADAAIDLPAPRPNAQKSVTDLPAPRAKPVDARPGGGRAMTDLPVPGIADTAPLADLPSPKPRATSSLTDLPAPRPKAAIPSIPSPGQRTPTPPAGIADLPKPKAPSALADLPSPKPAPKSALVDLPTPKPGGVIDLPMPKTGVTDLPMPKPGGAGDLPAPKGFFDDLPQPARGAPAAPSTDIAPKGFFEDLPQPARGGAAGAPSTDVAPKGFFDDLPQPATGGASRAPEVPAPKGFFDDLPGKTSATAKTEAVAPKGFFDDLPGKTSATAKTEGMAPKGFFDDLPGKPAAPAKPEAPAPKGFFDDLPKPAPASSQEMQLDSLDLEPAEHSQPGIELDLADAVEEAPRTKAPSVAPAPGPSSQFDDLDLSSPSPVSFAKKSAAKMPGPMPGGVATITPQAAAAAAAVKPGFTPAKSGEVSLELEEPRQGSSAMSATPKLAPKDRQAATQAAAASREQRARRRKIVGIAAVAVLALGGGGFYLYQRHAKAQAHEEAVDTQLSSARRANAASQWQKAVLAATSTLELEKTNAEALGIRAEALFALGIAEGGNQGRFGQARKAIADALAANKQHPALERAKALSPIAANQPEKALAPLQRLAKAAPKDASLQLYLGWAHAALGDTDAAIAAFDQAVAVPALKVHALHGRGRAKQAKGDIEGARADYAAVIDAQKDHVAAQVGLAATLPAAQIQQQEADLLAILALKDVEKREPRSAIQAWILAAEAAKRGGRLDVARERFRKALAIQAADTDALTGLAEVELRDGKLDLARETIEKALGPAPNDIRAQLVATEIAIAQKKYDDAAKRLEALAQRKPAPAVVDQARMKTLGARLYEAQGKEQDAIDAYLEAAKLAGERDLTPHLEAAAKLNALADRSAAANDVARASELRKRAEELLASLSDAALKDPALALTLGMAYMQANDAPKAETWLRKAIEMAPKNIDAIYQLAKALAKQGKEAEAIANLRTAVELDPTRTEIGIELARTYEDANRVVDAEKLYDKLLAAKEPPLELRARAGRFYARIGQMQKAGEQGVKILEQQDDHPAGLYLKGEGLLQAGKIDAARKLFVQASDADPEPQFLDARGRAAEKWAVESGNTTYQDDALRSYSKAVEKDPTIFASWLGMGRLYVARKEDAKAIEPLQKAWALKRTAEVARLMGIAVKNLNQQPKVAADWLEQSQAMERSADGAYHLALLYMDARVNSPKQAVASLAIATKMALDEEKNGNKPPAWLPEALYQLGDLRHQQNDFGGAKSAWQAWLNRNPPKDARYKQVVHEMSTTMRSVP